MQDYNEIVNSYPVAWLERGDVRCRDGWPRCCWRWRSSWASGCGCRADSRLHFLAMFAWRIAQGSWSSCGRRSAFPIISGGGLYALHTAPTPAEAKKVNHNHNIITADCPYVEKKRFRAVPYPPCQYPAI